LYRFPRENFRSSRRELLRIPGLSSRLKRVFFFLPIVPFWVPRRWITFPTPFLLPSRILPPNPPFRRGINNHWFAAAASPHLHSLIPPSRSPFPIVTDLACFDFPISCRGAVFCEYAEDLCADCVPPLFHLPHLTQIPCSFFLTPPITGVKLDAVISPFCTAPFAPLRLKLKRSFLDRPSLTSTLSWKEGACLLPRSTKGPVFALLRNGSIERVLPFQKALRAMCLCVVRPGHPTFFVSDASFFEGVSPTRTPPSAQPRELPDPPWNFHFFFQERPFLLVSVRE